MAEDLHDVAVADARVTLDLRVGNLRALSFTVGERTLAPLHRAPWADDPQVAADQSMPPVERSLPGDFLCAPFAAGDVTDTPFHGWTANSRWRPTGDGPGFARFRLARTVMGAAVDKEITLRDGSPILYQTHRIEGGDGGLTLAHHPMFRLQAGGRLSFSPKRVALTPDRPLVDGCNRLACPARTTDLSAFPAADGGVFDLHRYPVETGHEDFVTLVEAPGSTLGWTAVVREAEDDIVFVLKDPAVLPVTMLWYSNGGRTGPPWNGRHLGVLGIEDGIAAGAAGYAAALGPNPVSREGVATALPLGRGRTHVIRHAIGAIPRPAGWSGIADIRLAGDRLTLESTGGGTHDLAFDAAFLGTR